MDKGSAFNISGALLHVFQPDELGGISQIAGRWLTLKKPRKKKSGKKSNQSGQPKQKQSREKKKPKGKRSSQKHQ